MAFCDVAGRPNKELFPGITTRTFWGEKLLLSRVELAAHALAPLHNHPHEQGGVILQGEMDFTIGEETRHLVTGDLYIVPGNVMHEARAGAEGCVALEVFSPVRETLQY